MCIRDSPRSGADNARSTGPGTAGRGGSVAIVTSLVHRTGATIVRVRYAETDQMRVVYHANYFVWFEVGRTDLLRQLGWSYREMEHAGFQLAIGPAELLSLIHI